MEKDPKFTIENGLNFYRNFHQSKFNPSLGPLQGLSTTIVPTIGGGEVGAVANFDVLWAPKKIIELISPKPKIDPLQKYKDDPSW